MTEELIVERESKVADRMSQPIGDSSSPVRIIPYSALPSFSLPCEANDQHKVGALRELRDHPVLADFIPRYGYLSTNIVTLKAGERLPIHSLPSESLLLIMQGEGELIGDYHYHLEQNQLACIDRNCLFGVVAGESGISLVCMRFGERHLQAIFNSSAEKLENTNLTYQDILHLNEERLEECKHSPYFEMLTDDTLKDINKRKQYLNCLKKIGDHFQTILYTRQATCSDKKYETIFLQHLQDEIGHNEAFFDGDTVTPIKDSEFEAILTWFCYKMITLDNIGKTVLVNLVFESVGDYMCNFVQDKEIYKICPEYFHVHAEADEGHSEMAFDLLKNQHPEVYQRVINTTNEAWDMFMAMLDRWVKLVKQA